MWSKRSFTRIISEIEKRKSWRDLYQRMFSTPAFRLKRQFFEIPHSFVPFCSGWEVSRFSRRNADLVLSFSFSACMPRISTEKPSWDKKAWSPASCSRTRPKEKTEYKLSALQFSLNVSHSIIFVWAITKLLQSNILSAGWNSYKCYILTWHSIKGFYSDSGVGVWICQFQQFWKSPHAKQVDLHLWHILGTGSNKFCGTPPQSTLSMTQIFGDA